jgi:hypothetical protein
VICQISNPGLNVAVVGHGGGGTGLCRGTVPGADKGDGGFPPVGVTGWPEKTTVPSVMRVKASGGARGVFGGEAPGADETLVRCRRSAGLGTGAKLH